MEGVGDGREGGNVLRDAACLLGLLRFSFLDFRPLVCVSFAFAFCSSAGAFRVRGRSWGMVIVVDVDVHHRSALVLVHLVQGTYKEVEMGVREEEAERRFCFLNDRAGCGGVEYAAGRLLEPWN